MVGLRGRRGRGSNCRVQKERVGVPRNVHIVKVNSCDLMITFFFFLQEVTKAFFLFLFFFFKYNNFFLIDTTNLCKWLINRNISIFFFLVRFIRVWRFRYF